MTPMIAEPTSNPRADIGLKKISKILERYYDTPWDKLNSLFPIIEAVITTHLLRNPSEAQETKSIIQIDATDFLMKMNKFCDLVEKYGSDHDKIYQELEIFANNTRESLTKYCDSINEINAEKAIDAQFKNLDHIMVSGVLRQIEGINKMMSDADDFQQWKQYFFEGVDAAIERLRNYAQTCSQLQEKRWPQRCVK